MRGIRVTVEGGKESVERITTEWDQSRETKKCDQTLPLVTGPVEHRNRRYMKWIWASGTRKGVIVTIRPVGLGVDLCHGIAVLGLQGCGGWVGEGGG